MTETFTAIYEHGVFRPVVPIALPESAQVELTMKSKAEIVVRPATSTLEEALAAAREIKDYDYDAYLAMREAGMERARRLWP